MITAEGAAQERLHAQAAAIRDRVFERSVVVRGVIEITNLCRVNCDYCPMRRDNTRQNTPFTLDRDAVLAAARAVRDAGINVIAFQGGEIPQTTRLVVEVLPQVRALFNDRVEVLLGLGVKSEAEYRALKERGADTYIVKHETADAILHRRIRQEELEVRLTAIRTLLRLGYRVGSGCIVGLPGQTVESLADDIRLAHSLGVHMCSASPFVPTADTPFARAAPGSISRTLNVMAAMRLVNPHWLIPTVSALEQQTGGGQCAGLRAGANVITVNFTPADQRNHYLIYGGTRHIVKHEKVRRQIESVGLVAGGSVWVGA
ncbi:MAG TPA: radical SAM protein [Vicinamibacterales bacterium]|jgi:biotin synthase|nr:radical SAM protein [Vicinamibacterales bacterium]